MNSLNYYILMRNVKNLKGLTNMSLTELTTLMGVENGTKLYKFLVEELK